MSASEALLVFLDPHGAAEGWLHLAGGAVVARGDALEGLPDPTDPETGEPRPIVAVAPGEATSIHWLELPAGLAPAQAAAAARLLAAEASAQPIAEMHVAVGPEPEAETALRPVALVPAATMALWLERLQADALDPDAVVPEPLLLAAPEDGFVRHDRGPVPLYRGVADAFRLEPELAALILGEAPVRTIAAAEFEAGLAEAAARPSVDLRQGAFAKRRRWQVDWPLVRRLGLLVAGILLATLAIQIASIFRYTFAADALEAETSRVAASVLPGSGPLGDPAGRLERRLADLGGAGLGYQAMAAGLFGAVRATPNVQLAALTYDRDGNVRATVHGDTPAAFSALRERLEADGFAVDLGPVRSGGGRPTAEVTVRAP